MMLTDGRITRRDNQTGLEPEPEADVEDRIEADQLQPVPLSSPTHLSLTRLIKAPLC